MKKLLPLALASSARALTASFDSITTSSVQSGYSESGLTFTSPTNFVVTSGYYGANLFGWTGGSYAGGNALAVSNRGWIGITGTGLLDSVTFRYGFDWNGYIIELGLMDVNVEWQALSAGQVVAVGGLQFDRTHRSHGGGMLTADPEVEFDQLLVRSVAVEYLPIPAAPNPMGWFYDRGAVVGWGDLNHLAIDDVSAVMAGQPLRFALAAPDGGSALLLFALGLVALSKLRRFYAQ